MGLVRTFTNSTTVCEFAIELEFSWTGRSPFATTKAGIRLFENLYLIVSIWDEGCETEEILLINALARVRQRLMAIHSVGRGYPS